MVIKFPVPALRVVVHELEVALVAAKDGRLSSIAMSYMSDGGMYDCAHAYDYESAISLLGQSNMLRIDIIEMVKRFRDQGSGVAS